MILASAKMKYPGSNKIELSPPNCSLFSMRALKDI